MLGFHAVGSSPVMGSNSSQAGVLNPRNAVIRHVVIPQLTIAFDVLENASVKHVILSCSIDCEIREGET